MLKYVGNSWLKGVPARDLSDDEVKLYDKNRLLKSGLYKKPKKKPAKTAEQTAQNAEEL